MTAAPAGPLDARMWQLRLYIAGQTPRSTAALTNLTALCERHLSGLYRIEVIDLTEHPARARADNITAVPTLIRRQPIPRGEIIRHVTDTGRLAISLTIARRVTAMPRWHPFLGPDRPPISGVQVSTALVVQIPRRTSTS